MVVRSSPPSPPRRGLGTGFDVASLGAWLSPRSPRYDTCKFCDRHHVLLRLVGGHLDAERRARDLPDRDHPQPAVARSVDRFCVDTGHHWRSRWGKSWPDRWSRQRWIQLNNLVMAGTASALAVAALTHHLSPALACYLRHRRGAVRLRVVGSVAVAAARSGRSR